MTQDDYSLEENVLKEFLRLYPLPRGENAFDSKGRIKESIQRSPSYRGLADGLLGRPRHIEQYESDSDQLRYASSYYLGVESKGEIDAIQPASN